ncbi:MAG: glutathione S-transferase family protein [Proteobacteria bacterium]|nr:glutathione S-transferase family protein [Pseudomonadota bacterium]
MAAKKKAPAKKKPAKKAAPKAKPKKILKATPAIKAAAAKSAKKAAKGARIGKAGYDVPARKASAKAVSGLTLHGFHLSLPSSKVALLLNMLGVKWNYRHVDLRAGAHKTPDYLKLNRYGQVPVLVDGDEVVVQSNVILQYLADRFGAFGGSNPHEKRRIAEWLAWDLDRMTTVGQARFLRRNAAESPALPFLFGRGEQSLELLDRLLGTSKFLAGPNPTIADIAVFPWIATAEEAQYDATKYPNIRDWGQRMMKLPGVAHPYALLPQEDRPAVA